MQRQPKTPERQLADEAHLVGVLAFINLTALAAGQPHVTLYSRGGQLAALPSVDAARAWLRLHGTATG